MSTGKLLPLLLLLIGLALVHLVTNMASHFDAAQAQHHTTMQ